MANSERDNRSNQLNPNNDAFYQSRGYGGASDYDSDDDSGYSHGFYSSNPPPVYETPEERDRKFLASVRSQVASKMTTSEAGHHLVEALKFRFPELEFNSAPDAGVLKIFIRGCDDNPDLASQLQDFAQTWIDKRREVFGRCVYELRFDFESWPKDPLEFLLDLIKT